MDIKELIAWIALIVFIFLGVIFFFNTYLFHKQRSDYLQTICAMALLIETVIVEKVF